MLSTLVVISLLMGPTSATDQFTYQVQNVRASKLLQRMMPDGAPALIPEGVTAKANDSAAEIVFDGPPQGIEDVKQFLKLFDIQPMHAQLSLSIVAPIDHYRTDWQGLVANNAPTTITDGDTGLTIRLQPRINDDGTVTVNIKFLSDGAKVETVSRMRKSDTFECMIHEIGTKVEVPKGTTLLSLKKLPVGQATVRITAQLQG